MCGEELSVALLTHASSLVLSIDPPRSHGRVGSGVSNFGWKVPCDGRIHPKFGPRRGLTPPRPSTPEAADA
jgi:hypothetical protein